MDSPDALRIEAVVVPLDGSELAELAIGPAKVLASHLSVPLGAITVAGKDDEADERYLADAVKRHGLAWRHIEANHDLAEGILAAAASRDALVCMATHGHGRSGAVFGSTALEVLTRSTAPIVVIGRGVDTRRFRRVRRIVVPLDGTPESETVRDAAMQLAKRLAVPVELVTVAGEPIQSLHEGQPARRRFGHHEPEAYIADAAARWSTEDVAVTGEAIIDPISPASGLGVWMRERPDALFAMATHGRTGLQRLLHGSAAASILRESPVPAIAVAAAVDRS